MNRNSKALLKNLLRRKGIHDLNQSVGGLGLPSKMPGYAYGISASKCITGGKLAKIPGSVCHGCYAAKGNYLYPSVMGSHERRWESMADLGEWRSSMIRLLAELGTQVPEEQRYFRFHDSGDLQSLDHLRAIVRIAVLCTRWTFWLPTREASIVREYQKHESFPPNLTVRVSMPLVGRGAPRTDLPTSTVNWLGAAFCCPASTQDNECGTCRACWQQEVENVNYKLH